MKLQVTDLDNELSPEIQAALKKVADNPREKIGARFIIYDWQDVAVRYLRRLFPKFWIYRGGRHIAIHASAPTQRRREAGRLLARICETV